jgi:uncharacterized membrane protein YqgA involved in biofilm formation
MHFDMSTVLAAIALVASMFLIQTDRLFPIIALVASGAQFLLALGLVTLSIAKFRIDVILPALLLVSGAFCWTKVSSKYLITAATTITLLGAIELVTALRLLH